MSNLMRMFARWPIRPNWALADQVVVSGSKFAGGVLVARFLGRLPQDDADLVFHGPAMPRRAQPKQLFQLVVELPDGKTGHAGFRSDFRTLACY